MPQIGPRSPEILANLFARPWLAVHAAGAATALLVGPFQFLPALRRRLANVKKKVEPKPVDAIVTSIYNRLQVSENLFAVERLSKAYGEQVLFRDLSFEVHRGDRIVIVDETSGITILPG